MNSSLLKLQNTEVVVGLTGNHALARPGDTSKYFSRINGNNTERIYVDGCTSDSSSIFNVGDIQSYVKHAVEGGTSALFLSGSGITRMGDYDRKTLMTQVCGSIGENMARFDPDLSMTYAFVGVTDNKAIDFHRDRNINVDKLRHGLADLQHEVDDWEVVEAKILRGATLPFILSLHFESMNGAPTNGHLCIVDLNVVDWSPTNNGSNNAMAGIDASSAAMASNSRLQQSISSLSSMIHLLANDAILTGVTIPNNALVTLVGEFLYGESKTAFVIYQNTDESASQELDKTVELIKSLRKLKSRDIIRTVDRRVLFFYEKAKYYQGEKYRLQDELADMQEEKEQLEKDLDDIQRDYSEERDALFKEVEHWQNKSKALDTTMAALRTESAGMEADARWENAKLVTEKLAIKDELRRAEIEMTAAEDAKSQLLDLYESLQTSYGNLDSVYSELLEAYRLLKDKFGLLADERVDLQQSVADLEQDARSKAQQINSLRAEIASVVDGNGKRIEELEEAHAKQLEEFEMQLDAETQRTKELTAKVAQLETKNKSLAVSQTEEVGTLQSTIDELSSQLEEAQRQSASEASAMSAKLRATEKAAKRLEAERTKMQDKIEDLIVRNEGQAEFSERESQWQREREQMQRQIKRLQQTAQNAERRESELREESEQQWSAWEAEKNRNHQEYITLKERFRDAMENSAASAANVDLGNEDVDRDEGARQDVANGTANGSDVSTGNLHRAPRRRGAPQKQKKPAAKAAQVSAFSTSAAIASTASADKDAEDSDVEMMDASNDKESESVTRAPPPSKRTAAMRPRRAQPSYAESDGNEDNADFFSYSDRAGAGATGSGRMLAVPDEAPASKEGGNDSDDSEITFNAASMTPVAARAPPATKQRRPRAAPRQKKSAQELNDELSTQPARKKPGRPPMARKQPPATTTQPSSIPEKPPSPKRKRTLGTRVPRKRMDTASSSTAAQNAGEAAVTAAVASTANTLKKKRKLNLSRMRSLLGINPDRPAAGASTASNPQAVKFSVPRIRGAGSSLNAEAGPNGVVVSADQDDSD
ncbi:hypothetical protein GGI23_001972 [Coemansia sp. RSA 2559]|nr:hypothetical protein GGI23_001972 [Coemansia sp. RSA 2559]KAJ2862185.1 hypothetical protein GGI22_002257 [Coemansia erecta]